MSTQDALNAQGNPDCRRTAAAGGADPIARYARTIVQYSCSVKPGDHVLVRSEGTSAKPLVMALVDEIYRSRAYPHVELIDTDIQRQLLTRCEEPQMAALGDYSLAMLQKMNALVVISAPDNPYQYQDVPNERMNRYNQHFMHKCFYGYAVEKTRWLYIKYPNQSMAQMIGMSQEAATRYYYSVCDTDYAALSKAMEPLVRRLGQADQIRIIGPGTDLSFSVKGIPVAMSDGRNGLPDGEVFTAPVRESVNGVVTFNCPLFFRGSLLENIRLEVKDGRIIEATCSQTQRLNEILDTDGGSRHFGEFAFGLNPRITAPVKDILFDEKMAGSFHMAVGNAYAMTENGNHSLIHMDIVCRQTPECGGGSIYFDGELIRKDGRFVDPELQPLDSLT